MKQETSIVIALIVTICLVAVIATRVVKSIHFNQECGGHLKRAADANNIDLAKSELYAALHYIESNNLTHGYTSVVWNTPDEDLGFWYTNIKTSYADLDSLSSDATPMDKSNMLMKLRETLIDHGKDGDEITVPDGISRYPNNLVLGVLFWLFAISASISWTIAGKD